MANKETDSRNHTFNNHSTKRKDTDTKRYLISFYSTSLTVEGKTSRSWKTAHLFELPHS